MAVRAKLGGVGPLAPAEKRRHVGHDPRFGNETKRARSKASLA